MGNCETCDNVDRKSSAQVVLLKDPLVPESESTAPSVYDLPESCPEIVKDIYRKLGPFKMPNIS